MNIIIVGCGKVGTALAEQLESEGHEITVVDTDPEAVKTVTDVSDVMGVIGNGVVHKTLDEAGIEFADLFIAVTGSDELNLLCCLIANKTSSCRTVARVRNPDFVSESSFIRKKLGISMIINPELEAANEIARLFSIPSAIEVDTFANGRVELLTTVLPDNSPLIDMQIEKALGRLSGKMLICAVERNGEVIIPSGQTVLKRGDKISFVTTRKDCAAFFKKAGIARNHVKSIMIVGGGKITYYLTQKLCEYGFKVKIIEKSKERCEFLNSVLPGNVVIINGDGCDRRLLLEEDIAEVDGFTSITDFDEENIMLSVYVNANYDVKTVTKINRLNFEGLIDKLSVGSVVYPKFITCEMIISYVRALENSSGSNVHTLYNIVGSKAQAIEFNVRTESAVTNIPLYNLRTKPNTLLCCISRAGKIIIPSGDDEIKVGDTVVVVTTDRTLNDIKNIVI
ncbi:MAG: Trk system potassium transporter TrkA [Acutalibacteraceae bacterium]